MKKKLVMLMGIFSLIGSIAYGTEIIPEDYLMEKLLIKLENSPSYVSKDGETLKAVQLNNEILKNLNTNENPIYIYDSDGQEKLMRKGDYFVSSPRLSSIYMVEKDEFETKFRNENLPEKVVKTVVEVEDNKINPTDVDAGDMDIKEIGQ